MHVWLTLSKKHKYSTGKFLPDFTQLWKDLHKLPEMERWVLGSTLDNVIVPKPSVATLIAHLRKFVERYPSDTLQEEIEILEKASTDSKVRGVCFNQTSVCANPWTLFTTPTGRLLEDSVSPRGEGIKSDLIDDESELVGRPFNLKRDAHLRPRLWQLTAESLAGE